MIKTVTKYKKLLDILITEINSKYKPGDKIEPEIRLAKKHGVNRATVNKVIISLVNNGFLERKQGIGTFVKEKENVLTLGIVVASMKNYDVRHINGEVNINLLNGILNCSYDKKVKTEIITYFSGALRQDKRKDGFIIFAGDNEILEELKELNIPYIFCCNMSQMPEKTENAILNDVSENIYKCIDYLAKSGHRKIAYIGRAKQDGRLDAYIRALQENHLDFFPELLVERAKGSFDDGYSGAEELFSRGEKFDAVFCSTDLRAKGVLQFFQERGIKIPEDVSVMGYDNISIAGEMIPSLTTFEPARRERGMIAVSELLKLIKNKRYRIGKKIIEGKIIERKSVRRI
jgi:LacI family transcriptional regulator, galactose operon repressor